MLVKSFPKGFFLFKKFYKSINVQILLAVLVVSSCVTFLITLSQLYFDYREEINDIQKSFSLVERTYKEGLETALWNFDYNLLGIQTAGILNIPGIMYIEVSEHGKIIYKNGKISENNSLSYTLDLVRQKTAFTNETKIGELKLWGDLDKVYMRVWKKAGMTLLVQFLKTFLVSSAILIILNQILARHLSVIRRHLIENMDLAKSYTPLRLKRSEKFTDEIYSLEQSINGLLEASHRNFQDLNELNLNLEYQVQERSQIIADQQHQLVLAAKLSSLGEMAGGIAHEINTPLTVISLLAEQTKEVTDLKKVESLQNRILATVQRIGKIISSLKFLVRDSVREGIEEVSLKFLIDETVALCSYKLEQTKVKLIVEPYEERLIKCRAVQISLVLVNLIRNSIDAVENLHDRWIRISIDSKGSRIRFSVQDSGPGIPPEVAEKMFLPFYTTKGIGKGTGLGLSISYNVVANHQGTLSYNNSSGHTEFIVEIPQAS